MREERAKLRPDPRWTAFLADLHATDEKPIRPAGPLPARCRRRRSDGFGAWRESNVVPQRQPGLRHGDPHAAARRPDVRAGARAGRRRPQVHGRRHAHDRRAEHAAALGERGRPARRLRGAREDRPRDGRRLDDQRHHGLPGHRHVQARHLVVARARGRAHAPHPQVGHRQGPERQAPAHQGERLLQLVRAAPRRRPRLPRRLAQRGRAARAALPARRGRPVDEQRRLVRPGDRRRAVEARARDRQAPHGALREGAPGRGDVRRLREPHRQEDDPRDGRGAAGPADLRPGPELLQRLGRPARVHDLRHGRGRVRGRGRAVRRGRAGLGRARDLRGADAHGREEARRRERARVLVDAHRGARARQGAQRQRQRRRRRDRAASSASTTSTPTSSIRSRRRSSRSTSSARTRRRRTRTARRATPTACTSSSRRRRCSSTPPTSATRGSARSSRARPPTSCRPDGPMDAHKLQLKIYATPAAAKTFEARGVHPGLPSLASRTTRCPS